MPTLLRTLGTLALLLPTLSHAAGDAGTCRYEPVAKLDIHFSERTFRPIVDGSVNGVPVRMLVDTGAYETKLAQSSAERLGLTLRATGRYSTGIGGYAINYVTNVDDFALGGTHTGKTRMPVVGGDDSGRDRDLIVGANYLLQTDMELALADRYLRFFRASGCDDAYLAYWSSDAMEIPFAGLIPRTNQPLVTVELNGVKLKALLDTGATETVVTRRGAELAGVRVDGVGVVKASRIAGIGDERLDSWNADFKSFAIGDETVRNPRLRIADDFPQGRMIEFDVVLGADFLRAHRVLFAMSQQRLYLSYLGGELFGARQRPPAP